MPVSAFFCTHPCHNTPWEINEPQPLGRAGKHRLNARPGGRNDAQDSSTLYDLESKLQENSRDKTESQQIHFLAQFWGKIIAFPFQFYWKVSSNSIVTNKLKTFTALEQPASPLPLLTLKLSAALRVICFYKSSIFIKTKRRNTMKLWFMVP